MDYQEALEFVLGFTDYEKTPGIIYTADNYDLRRMEQLLQFVGNPHLGTRTVHIAGTKGKGSTAAMVAQVLTATGYRTGLFTSPHFHTMRERARIDGDFISETEFASIITELQPYIDRVNQQAAFGLLTTFEILTAAVFMHFKKNNIDFQVLEVGLGGRLDATNVVDADVCIITSISYDHTEVLGNTLSKIAAEKAGIIKPGAIVINFPQEKEAGQVIEDVCVSNRARLIQVGTDITWERTGGDLRSQSLTVHGKQEDYDLSIPLAGDFQLENASAAIAALEVLIDGGNKIPYEAIVKGFRDVNWPGRLQITGREPTMIVDGAHNTHSMERLKEAIEKYADYETCHVIFGTSCDKDISGMVSVLSSFADHITVTSSSHPRAASIDSVREAFEKQGIAIKVTQSVADALSEVCSPARKTDLVLVTGSLFVVGEALSLIEKT